VQPEGLKEMMGLIDFYKENASILKDTFKEMGFEVYGELQQRDDRSDYAVKRVPFNKNIALNCLISNACPHHAVNVNFQSLAAGPIVVLKGQ
jgi:hypothetical protein